MLLIENIIADDCIIVDDELDDFENFLESFGEEAFLGEIEKFIGWMDKTKKSRGKEWDKSDVIITGDSAGYQIGIEKIKTDLFKIEFIVTMN